MACEAGPRGAPPVLTRVPLGRPAGVGAVTRRDHPVTLLLQDLAGEIAEAGLVFDEEEGLDTAGYLGPDGRGLALGGSAGDPREVDGEARPLVKGAVDG